MGLALVRGLFGDPWNVVEEVKLEGVDGSTRPDPTEDLSEALSVV